MSATNGEAKGLEDRYRALVEQIGEAASRSGRRTQDILFVAVTKYATDQQVRALIDLGHVDLGESRAQQLVQRAPAFDATVSNHSLDAARQALWSARHGPTPAVSADHRTSGAAPRVRWHMIGHLQRNKVKQVAPLADLIHSVDSLRLAEELHGFAARMEEYPRARWSGPVRRREGSIPVLVQVNASGESSKYGLAPGAVLHFAEQLDTMVHLELRGLMTMAPYSDDPEDARSCFARCTELFHEIRHRGVGGDSFNILSMGMSGDFTVAIEEGANCVRIGSALFGEH